MKLPKKALKFSQAGQSLNPQQPFSLQDGAQEAQLQRNTGAGPRV